MLIVTTALLLLVSVVLSSWIVRALPFGVPLPIVQILIGIGVAVWTPYETALEPHVFFALFIPLLLFLDAWRIPRDDLRKDVATIVPMAVGLVFLTVVGIGLLISWMVPSMPVPVAFALAAILSPTDPVAVSGITARIAVPKRLMHILEGEALLNDASGLSAFRIAVAVMLTGHFSLSGAGVEFMSMAVGGAVIGAAVTVAIVHAQNRAAERLGEDSGTMILGSLLIPFAAYFGAEAFHFSGVLAAAVAGISMGWMEMGMSRSAVTRMRRAAVWDTVATAANGVIFVLLGEQLPAIWDRANVAVWEADSTGPAYLFLTVIVIVLAMAVIRFAWVWTSFRLITFRKRGWPDHSPNWVLAAAATFAGVRGSVTLAGIMTLPLLAGQGPFPARELSIFISAGVIILTMVMASVALPFLMRGLEMPEEDETERVNVAMTIAARAAIRAIEDESHRISEGRKDADITAEAANRVMSLYEARLHAAEDEAMIPAGIARQKKTSEDEMALRLAALRAERAAIARLVRHRKMSEHSGRVIIGRLDLDEARIKAERASAH